MSGILRRDKDGVYRHEPGRVPWADRALDQIEAEDKRASGRVRPRAGRMKFFVFVDMEYYPYSEIIEADTERDAMAKVADGQAPGTEIHVVPFEAVKTGVVHGPPREPVGLFKLLQESNRYRRDVLDAKNLGGFHAVIEPGSMADGEKGA